MNTAGFLEEAQQVRQDMQENQALMASLDAEIAKAQAALQDLVNQRAAAQRLLETNHAPSESETQAIREIIHSKEGLMEELQAEITHAQAALDALLADAESEASPEIESTRAILTGLLRERETTYQALEAHRKLLSPDSEIFLHCLPKDGPYVQVAVNRCPLLLMRVSSSWREVALSTPALWTSMTVNISTTSCLPNMTLIKTWLGRSGSCPLSLHITESIQKDYYDEGMLTAASILELYTPHYHRWRSVRLEYQDWRIDTGFSKLPCDTGPPRALESLHLARDFWPTDEETQLSLLLNTDLGTLSVPFPNLRRLFLERPLVREDFMRILSEGASIDVCQFFVLASSGSNLELPLLTNLSVRRFDNVPHPTPVWPHQQFMSFLTRLISMSDIDITPSEMSKLILTNDRRMRHTIIDDDVLRLLTWAEGSDCVCPRLAMLKFWDCQKTSDGVLADMIESRWKPRAVDGLGRLLNIAFFMLEEANHPEDMERLSALNDERIGITILRR
ncbi:hypothetical protein C8F01DRAFT_1120361 [Mycena amicta]|nr:hypothetical protein C8F01DRAFT_1120361 [Mycena amicta]